MEHDYLARGDFVYRDAFVCDAVQARGACIVDAQGKRWIDLEAANGAALFGYDSTFASAACSEWSRLCSVPSFVESAPRKRYAKRLGQKIANSLGVQGRLVFDVGGAQGVELAVRIASYRNPQRRTLVVLDGCYHGRTLCMSNVSSSYRYRDILPASGYRIVRLPVPALVASDGQLSPGQALLSCKVLARQIFTSQLCGVGGPGGWDVLALLYEPILNVAGMVDPTIEYLDYISGLAKGCGAVVIADEVFTGCHRFRTFLASEQQLERPDLLVMSKALTNGMVPMSAVWGREELSAPSSFPPGSYSTTFGNSPINFIVANLVLDRIERINGSQVAELECFLRAWCDALTRSVAQEVVATQVQGLTAFVEFRTSGLRDAAIAALASYQDAGVLVARTGMSATRLLLHPPLTLDDAEKSESIAIAARALH